MSVCVCVQREWTIPLSVWKKRAIQVIKVAFLSPKAIAIDREDYVHVHLVNQTLVSLFLTRINACESIWNLWK